MNSLLHTAAEEGLTELMECLDESARGYVGKADIHARNEDGETALHVIARSTEEDRFYSKGDHDKTLFKFLIGKGLDPLAEDKRGRSSLDVAAACGKKDILDLFQYRS